MFKTLYQKCLNLASHKSSNFFLGLVNLFFYKDYFWMIWPLTFWGLGLFIHFLGVFVFNNQFSNFRNRWVEDLMEKK